MTVRSTLALLAAGSALTASWSMPALAQVAPDDPTSAQASAKLGTLAETAATDASAEQPVPAQPGSGEAAGSAADAQDTGGISVITVTAQRRAQNMQDVPISITAADADMLANMGIRSTADLSTLAPAVTFAVGLGGGAPAIRGVSGTGAGTDEAANALYIDGVYMPSPQGMVFQFNDIERIEVLKGPQGTLFGRNASGGLIQIISKTPHQAPEARFEIGYANYDTFRAAGSISGGLTDNLAISASGVFENQGDGWGYNFTRKEDAYRGRFYGGRAKVVWEPGVDTTITGTAMYTYSRPAGTQGGQILPGERIFGGGTALGFYDQSMDAANEASNTDYNYALTIKHDFHWATFTSISSRDVSTSKLNIDSDLGPLNRLLVQISGPKKSWTQEFQVGSPSGSKLQWIVGLFYYHSDWFQAPSRTSGTTVPLPLLYRDSNARQRTDSYAAYGQATVPLTATTNVTAGLRYTIDKRQHDVTTSTSNPATPPTVFPTEHAQDEKLTWRFAVDQEITDRVLAYASYSRGFKSGLFNIGNPGNPPVRPQTIDAYELGLKSDLAGRHVRLNLSAFRYDITDVQLRTTVPPNPAPIFYNAAKSRVYGAEAELQVYVSPRFSVQANVAYLSGEYTSFPAAVFYSVNAAPGFGLTVLTGQNATGKDTVYTPHWVSNLSAQYNLPTAIGKFTLGATWNYNDGFFYDPQNRLANPSYNQVNANLTWEPEDGKWVRLWVNNLLDERYYSTVQPSNFGDLYFPAPPRTFGVTVGAEF
jgi:iron complex outermembrane receptor protein